MSAAIEPSDEVAWVTRASCAKTKPTAIQPQTASERSLQNASQSIVVAMLMTAVAASASSTIWATVHHVMPAQLDRLRQVGTDGLGDLGTELLDVDAGDLHRVPEWSPESCRLQVGEQGPDPLAAERLDRRAHGPIRPRQCRRRDEELDAIGLELILAG